VRREGRQVIGEVATRSKQHGNRDDEDAHLMDSFHRTGGIIP
jgi:hypothetical protein